MDGLFRGDELLALRTSGGGLLEWLPASGPKALPSGRDRELAKRCSGQRAGMSFEVSGEGAGVVRIPR